MVLTNRIVNVRVLSVIPWGKYHPHGDSSIYGALVNMGSGMGPQDIRWLTDMEILVLWMVTVRLPCDTTDGTSQQDIHGDAC
mgnify:CR=1 FL=1